jgi:predicted amidohydrolase YtcJ
VEVGGRRVDVRVEGGVVVAVEPGLAVVGARTVDGGGGALLPGLHDHHTHLLAAAAASASARVGPTDVDGPGGLAAALRHAAARAPAGAWVRAVGYHESVAGDLDRRALDAAVADRPVRVQHRSGALWVLNGAALAAVGPLRPLPGEEAEAGAGRGGGRAGVGVDPHGVERDGDGEPTGRFFRSDRWLSRRWPPAELDLAALGRRLLACGVTGVTDATPFATVDGPDRLARAVAAGDLPQHVVVTGGPALAGAEPPAGLGRGPVKLLLHDHDLPPVEVVTGWVGAAHAAGRPVAVHCVTAEALVVTMAALAEAGPHPGDRVEHAAVVPAALVPDLVGLGVTVVTQPNLVAERGDAYRRDVEPHEHPDLWRCASLAAAGIPVAAGTDAPYGDPDPWRAIAAATDRRTPSGAVLGGGEALPPERALALFLGAPDAPGGPPRRVTPGAPADLCLLHVPLAVALAGPSSAHVRRAFVAGRG